MGGCFEKGNPETHIHRHNNPLACLCRSLLPRTRHTTYIAKRRGDVSTRLSLIRCWTPEYTAPAPFASGLRLEDDQRCIASSSYPPLTSRSISASSGTIKLAIYPRVQLISPLSQHPPKDLTRSTMMGLFGHSTPQAVVLQPFHPPISLNAAFCTPYVETLIMKEKVWSLSGDDFSI